MCDSLLFSKNNPIEETHQHDHYIIYCNHCSDCYSYIMNSLRQISPSSLKYNRKTTIEYYHQDITFPMSDIHIEIDFELLGVNEYSLFFEIFNHLTDNVILNMKKIIVVCLHFDTIKKKLMDVFYNFLDNPRILFIFSVKDMCYIHPYIIKHSIIKKYKSRNKSISSTLFQPRIDVMIAQITGTSSWSLFEWREKLYELLIYNYNMYDCFEYIIRSLIDVEYLNDGNIDLFFKHYGDIMETFNNNYRTIYHIERFIIFLRNLKDKS